MNGLEDHKLILMVKPFTIIRGGSQGLVLRC